MKKLVKTLDVSSEITNLSDEAVQRIQFSAPWSFGNENQQTDEDGFAIGVATITKVNRKRLQALCLEKFESNPQVNTSIRGIAGRLCGFGFDYSSDIMEIDDVLQDLTYDQRNRLYHFFPKYVASSYILGELFLLLTVHNDGFIEIDFIDPSAITGGSDVSDGVISHPSKPTMPLIYCIDNGKEKFQVPSVYAARYPELLKKLGTKEGKSEVQLDFSRNKDPKFRKMGGFNRFIVSWDRGLVTKRSTGHLKTVLEWLNIYEDLKKYEIEHKKSCGAYVWLCEFQDIRSYKLWLSLTDEEKKKTGIMAKKTPGGTLVLPPGMKFTASQPNLPKISDSDTDIMHMITSGLNEPEDVSTGQAKGTFASVKASRGPMSDRIADEIEHFRKFLTYDFWGSLFYLKSQVTDFPETFKVREAVAFKNKKPVFKERDKRPEFLIEITFPSSEDIDYEGRARAFLGTKHGSTYATLGVSHKEIARKMGIHNYRKLRLETATEDENYPELMIETDVTGTLQDNTNGTKEGKVDPNVPVDKNKLPNPADNKVPVKNPPLKKNSPTPKK